MVMHLLATTWPDVAQHGIDVVAIAAVVLFLWGTW